jgi:hypothetical protein
MSTGSWFANEGAAERVAFPVTKLDRKGVTMSHADQNLPVSYTSLADEVASALHEMAGVLIPELMTPEIDDLLTQWLAKHDLRIEKPMGRFVQADPSSEKRWKHVSAEEWQEIAASAA